uniref:WRC domain-containing protein n=1 Tax=Oryza nivara TaxID=4536 RepID=A0A0E0J1M1_ORYNI
MRIRRNASRVLGSAYFTTQSEASRAYVSNLPPTSSTPAPVAYGGGSGDLGGPMVTPDGACQLSLSPWDLPYELEDPDPLEAPFDRYMACIPFRASFVSDSDNNDDDQMEVDEDKSWNQVENEEVNDQQQPADHKVDQSGDPAARKMKGKMNESSMVVMEMQDADKQAGVWYCNKNDGKKWHCRNIVDGPKTLCDYHLAKSRSYYTRTGEAGAAASSKSGRAKAPAIAKPKSSSKRTPAGESSAQNNTIAAAAAAAVSVLPTISSQPSKRKASNGLLGGDAYYFYDMFVPYRKKDRGGSSSKQQAGAEEKEILPQDNAVAMEEKMDGKKLYDGVYNSSDYSSDTASDDESDEDYTVGGASKRRTKKRKMKLSVKKVQFSKIMKKRVKERSLKSLL